MASQSDPLDLADSPPEAGDFLEPIEFILNEHYRQRRLCDRLDELTADMETSPVAQRADALQTFLTEDLRLHLEDEERDFFPLLRKRCKDEDEVGEILDMLSQEHELDRDLVGFLLDDLKILASGQQLVNPIRFLVNVREFTETQRRHLAWENAMVLPLARRRLNPGDLAELGRSMATRRGLDPGS